jgi:hypothetical protein
MRPEREPTLRTSDFGLPRPADRAMREGRIARVRPRVPTYIVNNAGSSHEMPVAFAETSTEEIETIIQVVGATSRRPR